MFRNTMRGVLALLLTFVANWLADWIMDASLVRKNSRPRTVGRRRPRLAPSRWLRQGRMTSRG
jgi:hypothetical protein